MKNLLVIGVLIISLSSCSLIDSSSSSTIPVISQQSGTTLSESVMNRDVTNFGNSISSDRVDLNNSGGYKTYSNSHYGISFDYPSDFTIKSSSGVMSWDQSGNIDKFEDAITLSGSRGIIYIKLPDDTVSIGVPILASENNNFLAGSYAVKRTLICGAQELYGPDNKGCTWIAYYNFIANNKSYRLEAKITEGVSSKTPDITELEEIIKDIIQSFQ